jgi:hypothetical protein
MLALTRTHSNPTRKQKERTQYCAGNKGRSIWAIAVSYGATFVEPESDKENARTAAIIYNHAKVPRQRGAAPWLRGDMRAEPPPALHLAAASGSPGHAAALRCRAVRHLPARAEARRADLGHARRPRRTRRLQCPVRACRGLRAAARVRPHR